MALSQIQYDKAFGETVYNNIERNQMEEQSKEAKQAVILKTELVIGGVLLALGLEALLGDLLSAPLDWTSLAVRFGLFILVVWSSQLLTAWEQFYQEAGADQLSLGGLPHLWLNIAFIGLVYLACKNHSSYFAVLSCITAILILDFVQSSLEWISSPNKKIKDIDKNWLIRDLPALLFLALAWFLYLIIDHSTSSSATPVEGIVVVIGIAINYIIDLILNRDFYGTAQFFQPVVRFHAELLRHSRSRAR